MNLEKLVQLALLVSVALGVLAIGLETRREEVNYLLRDPGRLVRSLVSMNLLMPLAAIALVTTFALLPALKLALVALSVSPVSPLLPGKELKAGARRSYAVSLFFLTGLLAVVFVPLAAHLVGDLFGRSVAVPPRAVVRMVLLTVLLPLLLGAIVNRLVGTLAQRAAGPLARGAGILLLVAAVPVLIAGRREFVALIGDGTLVAILALSVVGLTVGHLLGGPGRADRSVLALSTASRHPGVAIAVVSATGPGQKLTIAAVLLYLLVAMVVSRLYLKWFPAAERP